MEITNVSNNALQEVQKNVANKYLNPDGTHRKKIYAVMLFATELELGISNNPNKWECISVVKFYNGSQALSYYTNTPNPASCLLDSFDEDDLNRQIEDMKKNYKDEDYLNEFLYPRL
jgi:hypothetical protein